MRYELLKNYYDSPQYLAKIRARASNLEIMANDPLRRARLIVDVYAVDVIRFVEDFGVIKLTEFNNSVKPFFLFDYQKKILRRLQDGEMSNQDLEFLIDKPRGMGLTWILLWYMYWRWLFQPQWSGFLLSRTEAEVDDGSTLPDGSLFGKLRWMISKTPSFMIPEGFTGKGKKGTSTDMSLRLINPALGSSLIGSTTNANAGRSRRYSFILVDECFSIENFQAVWRSLQTVARVKVFISTVKAGKIYQDFKDLLSRADTYISLTWKDHPFKDQIWYEEILKKSEYDPEVMKEVEVNYAINPRSQYYPEIAKSIIEPEILYDRGKPLYVSLDIGRQDLTVLIWHQYDGQFFNVIECYANRNRPIEWYAAFLNPDISYNPDKYTPPQIERLNRVRTFKKPVAYFGEEAHNHKVMPLNTSPVTEFHKFGVRLMWNNNAIKYEPRRLATSVMLPKARFNGKSDYVMQLYDSLANSRYTNTAVSKDSAKKPIHDYEISDYRSAYENFAVNFPRVLRNQRGDMRVGLADKSAINSIIKILKV